MLKNIALVTEQSVTQQLFSTYMIDSSNCSRAKQTSTPFCLRDAGKWWHRVIRVEKNKTYYVFERLLEIELMNKSDILRITWSKHSW